MSSLNKVMLIGNVGKAPEIRTTKTGGKVAQLSLATTRKWTDSSGQKQEKTEWHRLVVWNRGKSGLADVVERYVNKGDKLYAEGSIETRSYEKDGDTKYVTEINVSDIVLLGGGKRDAAPDRNDAPADEFIDDDGLPF